MPHLPWQALQQDKWCLPSAKAPWGGLASPQSFSSPSTPTRPPVSILMLQGTRRAQASRPGSPCWGEPDLCSPNHSCQQGSPAHTCHSSLRGQPGPASSSPIPLPAKGGSTAGTQGPRGMVETGRSHRSCDQQSFNGARNFPFHLSSSSHWRLGWDNRGLHSGWQAPPPGLPAVGWKLESPRTHQVPLAPHGPYPEAWVGALRGATRCTRSCMCDFGGGCDQLHQAGHMQSPDKP